MDTAANAPAVDLFLNAAVVVLPIVYLTGAIGYGGLFFAGSARAGLAGSLGLRLGVLLHLLYLAALTARHGQFPAADVSQVLSGIACAVAIVYLVLEWHSRERSTGMWILGFVALFQLLASLTVSDRVPALEAFTSPLFGLHVALALLAYAAFTLAAGYGVLFLSLYRELKGGRFQTFFNRLPPLEILERMLHGALTGGLLCLTGAIAAGALSARSLGVDGWIRDPWSLITLATWGLYAATLALRRSHRWQGRQIAVASLVGVLLILVALLAVHAAAPRFHGFEAA